MAYKIQPINEPRGEGNGWENCTDEQATGWAIEDEEGETWHVADSAKEAQEWITRHAN